MLHGIYCFPFFHPNRPFIVFPPLSSVSLPHSPVLRQLILSYSPCSQPRYSYVVFFSISKPIKRLHDLPTHTIRKHTCVDADTHTWIFKQASHSVFTHTLMVCAVAEMLSPALLLPWRCNLGITTSSLSLSAPSLIDSGVNCAGVLHQSVHLWHQLQFLYYW